MSGDNGEKPTQKITAMGDNNGEKLLQRKTISPYDITANDNPGSLITQVQLKGENYDEWARSLPTALRARKKFAELANCKQLGLSIVAYYGKLKKLWEELGDYEQMPTCKCGLCECNLGSAFAKRREDEKVHQFLMGLDETLYGTVRSNLLAQDPLPNLNKIYSTLVQEERVKTLVSTKEERGEVMSFAVNTAPRSYGRGDRKEENKCTNCNRTRHESSRCFEIIGYPEWWNERPRPSGQAPGRNKGGRGDGVKANVVQSSTSGARRNDVVSDVDRAAVTGLNNDQWETLKNILNATKIGANEKLTGKHTFIQWIYDSGASHHMTGWLQCMSEVRDIMTECSVGLPNGKRSYAIKEGTITLDDKITLKNVLYVPDLKCNLISVYQLLDDYDGVAQFTNKFCVMRDRTSRMLIGAGEQLEGLYFYKRMVNVMAVTARDVGLERQFNKQVKVVRSDNGTEFICMDDYFRKHGIVHETSCVGTPQQNGRVERKHRHILNMARALRFQSNLPIEFWGECILAVGYLINRTPSVVLHNKTPYEMLHGKPPSFDNLRVFGCWRVFDLNSHAFLVSRDVVFYEDEFSYLKHNIGPTSHETNDHIRGSMEDWCDLDNDGNEVHHSVNHEEEQSVDQVFNHETSDFINDEEAQNADPGNSVLREGSNDTQNNECLGRGHRNKVPSTRLKDFVTNTVHTSGPSTSSFVQSESSGFEPQTFKEAMKDENWRSAMQKEIQALENNGTWIVTTLPVGKKAIGSKWVYKIKYHSDGSIERYKARLVILGNNQVEGLDYNETFAPVAKMVTVRTFLAVASAKNWDLHQMDVHNAFLHGDLEEKVYMKFPPGFQSSENKVCRLRKSLYGLKQAPRCWFAKLAAALKQYGFHQSTSDYSLFTLQCDKVHLNVLVYVDDLIISGNDSMAICSFKSYLSKCFYMKDLGTLKYFLGIEVARNSNGIFLCQRKYALDIISEAGLLGAKPTDLPLEQNHQLPLANGKPLVDPEPYRRLVGRLIYLSFTRPDLSYCVHMLAQFMQSPLQEHWDAALRVVRYLKGSPGQGILLRAACDLQLHGWAACPITRRSLTGWFIQLGDTPISWKTKKQHMVSRSSAEAEYRSMATTTCELKWLKALLLCLGVAHPRPMKLSCDNQAALHISANPVFHKRTKHIEVDCHFIRDEILKGNIATRYVPTHIQLADIFTKELGEKEFDFFSWQVGHSKSACSNLRRGIRYIFLYLAYISCIFCI
ncbi:retrovirus-related pol polyprotein from transposon TNT 1-94 [Tanacetum coccineum]|uniref:Retrovirus-related pol polyprotein from transposon TNT 1-94 n=1 Tax=Tanacetum coccineum TaxID=301880 RepID=A0ABQ5FM30_9ASTR